MRLLGGDPWRDASSLHRRLAYVPGDVDLWPTLTGGEVIDLLGRLRGGVDPRRRADLLERFDLDPTRRRAYSKGNRQKVALVAALASDVELLLLDEPTSGLDPLMEAVFTECVREEARAGRTVLLSSHILAEVEALCDRVSIIRAGRTVQHGTLAELRHLTRTTVVAETHAQPAGLDAVPGVAHVERTDGRVRSTSTPTTWTRRCPTSRRFGSGRWWPPADPGGAVPAAVRRPPSRRRHEASRPSTAPPAAAARAAPRPAAAPGLGAGRRRADLLSPGRRWRRRSRPSAPSRRTAPRWPGRRR